MQCSLNCFLECVCCNYLYGTVKILLTLIFSIHTAVQCSPLLAITNGVITYAPDTIPNYDLGTVATYECNSGFVLDLSLGGSMTRTCFDDLDNDAEGVFSGQAPRCIRKWSAYGPRRAWAATGIVVCWFVCV